MTDNFYVPIRTFIFNKNILVTMGKPVYNNGFLVGYVDLHIISHEEYQTKYRSKVRKLVK